jgi:AraC-like DNA-binding protein
MPVLELRIAWENQVEGTWDKIVQPSLKPHFFSLSFTPHVLTRAVFAGQQQYATFDIHFDLSFLASLGFDYATLDLFLQQVQKDQPAELSAIPHPCPGEMVDAVQAILNNSYSLKARPHLLEYKVKEILLSALEAIGRSELQLLPFALQPRDIEALHQAKAFIREQLPDWPSPGAICRATGLNELKLKIGFKHLFQLTPYEYYIELKMQEAKRLLLEGKESIVSIAYLSGYDHPSSFCREFKKAFGYTPGYFRQHGNY